MNKKLLVLPILLLISYCSFSQGVGIGTANPDNSAALDITNVGKGLLIPRMSTGAMLSIPGPARGLLVYDSLVNQLMVNTGTPAAPNWQAVANSTAGWALSGNAGINLANQFVGTTDNQPLRFRINNIQAGELNPQTGNIFWGLQSGQHNTSGFSNISIGPGALNTNTTISNLVAIGDSALFHNGQNSGSQTDGTINTALGSKSLFANTTGSGNTATGFSALNSNTTGDSNTAVGQRALIFNTAGSFNTALGSAALNANNTGNFNTAAGTQALFTNTGGFQNTAIGANALKLNTTGSDCTAIGFNALFSNTTGFVNTATGFSALFSNTTGSFNTADGEFSLNSNTTGFNNTATGNFSLQLNATGSNNTGTGVKSMFANLTGFQNTANGAFSLQNNVSGSNNTATGYQSMVSNTTGIQNTAIGVFSLASSQTGNNNTATGFQSLLSNQTGSQNTAVGPFAGNIPLADSNNSFIGFDANNSTGLALFNSTALGAGSRITASNQVRIGNSTTASIGGAVGFSTLSDGRYKKNIQENVKGIDFILKLRPVTYQLDIRALNHRSASNGKSYAVYRPDINENGQTIFTGFVAQEVEQAARESGYDFSGIDKPKNEQDLYGLRYADFVVPLVKAVQEQQQMIRDLRKSDINLRNQNADLLQRIEKLESSINIKP